jgi:hypothetical protein
MFRRLRWYNYLVKSDEDQSEDIQTSTPRVDDPKEQAKRKLRLLECETLDSHSLVICQHREERFFAKFPSYLDFGKFFIQEVQISHQCFYEVIFGDSPQKPYFDIDIEVSQEVSIQHEEVAVETSMNPPIGVPRLPVSRVQSHTKLEHINVSTVKKTQKVRLTPNEADEAIRTLTETILQLIPEIRSGIRGQILVFTSHSNKKLSYHIIVDGWCFPEWKECRYFHDDVVKLLPSKWKDIVDHGMYKSLQQLRTVGSHKWQDMRVKVISQELSVTCGGANGWIPAEVPVNDGHLFQMLLGASLVTNTSDCHLLPSFAPPEPPKKTYSRDDTDAVPLDKDSVDQAIELCAQMGKLTADSPGFPYKLEKWSEPKDGSVIIILRRLRPSMCRTCQRIHEHENPYIIVAGRERNVYFDCRRNFNGEKLYLGSLGAAIRPFDPAVDPLLNRDQLTNNLSRPTTPIPTYNHPSTPTRNNNSNITRPSQSTISNNNIPLPSPPPDLFAQLYKASEERARPMKVSMDASSPSRHKNAIHQLGGWKL